MATAAVARQTRTVARPLKTLVPMIADEIRLANKAGLEHYRRAGELLLEARDQVAAFKWGAWLSKNFTLTRRTAERWMRLAEEAQDDSRVVHFATLDEALGTRPSDASRRRGEYQPIRTFTAHVDRDRLAQERQVQQDEIRLHRELALELVDIGYKALATRLHPDKGGSRDAMRRLNRVRDELRGVAENRRFE